MTDWQSRFTDARIHYAPASQFTANPNNPRVHPQNQRAAVKASLDSLGWVLPVIVLKDSGLELLDGHERVWQATAKGEDTPVPYLEIDLMPHEVAQFLLTFDYITTMARYDLEITRALADDLATDDAAVQAIVDSLLQEQGIIVPSVGDWLNSFDALPDTDRQPFQQMAFTLHDEQVEQVKRALAIASKMGAYVGTINENSNGNALARICEAFITANG